jgi:LysR family hydrogen peroxide-inducible transcriptional activator
MEYIVSSAHLGCFGKAANECYISQPTISGQVKQVERYLGITIFERGRKGVTVTPEGRTVVELAQRILDPYKQLLELRASQVPMRQSTLRFGVFPTLAPYLLPRILPRIHQQYPQMKLHLVEEKTQPMLAQLEAGELDTVLIALPIESRHLHTEAIFSENFYCAAHKSHPLSSHASIKISHLRNHRLMLLEDGHCMRKQALDVCKIAQTTEHRDLSATSMETLKYMVAANTGITLVPEIAKSKIDSVCYIPFDEPEPPQRHIGMAWRKSAPGQDFYHEFNAYIKEAL